MDPRGWEGVPQGRQRELDPNRHSGAASRDCYLKFPSYTAEKSEGLRSGARDFLCRGPGGRDADGEPLETEAEHLWLTGRRRELKDIEERILHKRASNALKTVELIEKAPPACDRPAATLSGASLRDRVDAILRQRRSPGFLKWSRERATPRRLSGAAVPLEDHPLKRRVKALMRQRGGGGNGGACEPPSNYQVPEVPPLPPGRSAPPPVQEENANKGFQRFLSLLNKGVDVDLLSRIVNDDSEDLLMGEGIPNIQPPVVESNSDWPSRSRIPETSSRGLLPESRDKMTADLPGGEQSRCGKPSLKEEEGEDVGGGCRAGSSSRSKSPPTAGTEKRVGKRNENPHVDAQREQLQNILDTLGLSLEVEEMSRLADRTQERLYGKRNEASLTAGGKGEQESRQGGSRGHRRNPSSSSSSSRSTSRSSSPGSLRSRRSHGRSSRERGTRSERGRSRDQSSDGLTHQGGTEDAKGASSYPHPCPQNPSSFSDFSDYGSDQHSGFAAYHDGTYSAAPNPYWTYSQDADPSSLYPGGYPYPPDSYDPRPGSLSAANATYHDGALPEDLLVNPDLSRSEGQTGSVSGRRCLQVVSTKQTRNQRCVKTLKKGKKSRGNPATWRRKFKEWKVRKKEEKKQQRLLQKQSAEAPPGRKEDPDAEQSEEEKPQPTEEEVKANLRKKLEAFNHMVKTKSQRQPNP